jgi:HPt (histidine-containing phosphotransfer) domain-containing protein
MNTPATDIAAQLAALSEEFRHSLPERLARLEREVAALPAEWNEPAPSTLTALSGLRANAHSLAGAAGTFGMLALGQLAHELEILTQQLLTHPERRNQSTLSVLRSLFESLTREAGGPASTSLSNDTPTAARLAHGKAVFVVDGELPPSEPVPWPVLPNQETPQ